MICFTSKLKRMRLKVLNRILFTLTTDNNGIIIDASKGFESLSGYSSKELIGKTPRILSYAGTPVELVDDLWSTIIQNKTWYGEIKNRHKSGRAYWNSVRIEPLVDEEHILGYFAIYTNITKQKELIRQANSDPLTGIYNRSKLNLLLTHEIQEAYRGESTFSLLFIDLDHFKQVNDHYGHQKGDQILIDLTTIVRYTLRNSDIFGRWGGEEFLIILPGTDAESAYLIAEKLRHCIQSHDFTLDDSLTISIGISEYDPIKSIDEMIAAADEAMYQAKEQGRNKTVIYDKKGEKNVCNP